ncbi:hypothetical protein DPSP01_011366 [Paraphaeosphaeria sporulosa]
MHGPLPWSIYGLVGPATLSISIHATISPAIVACQLQSQPHNDWSVHLPRANPGSIVPLGISPLVHLLRIRFRARTYPDLSSPYLHHEALRKPTSTTVRTSHPPSGYAIT